MRLGTRDVEGVLLDMDGVLYVGNTPIAGAVESVARLPVPHAFLTNTTTQPAAALCGKLRHLGFRVELRQVLTAPLAALDYLKQMGSPPALLLLAEEVVALDFAGYPTSETAPHVIVVGDIGTRWDYALLNRIFQLMLNGARLLALHKNKFWKTEAGLQLDLGCFIAGLEYVTQQEATLAGKPSPLFFQAALERLALPAASVAMVGDDIDSDVGGAQAAGLLGVLVRTGKYTAEYAARSRVEPDLVLDSVAHL